MTATASAHVSAPAGDSPEGALVRFAEGGIAFDDMYVILASEVAEAARLGASQVANRYPVDPDDVAQELWLMMPTIAQRYDARRPAGPFIAGYGKKIALSLAHDPDNITTLTDVIFENEEHGEAIDRLCGGNDGGIPDINEHIDRRRTLEIVMRKLRDAGELESPAAEYAGTKGEDMNHHPEVIPLAVAGKGPMIRRPLPAGDVAPRAPVDRELNADQAALIKWRRELDMTQQEFAASLNIGVPRLVSYEHGKTASVPPEIMVAAKSLWSSLKAGAAMRRGRYADRTMADIFYDWVEKFGIAREDYDKKDFRIRFQREHGVGIDVFLADMLGTTVPTISRWRDNKTMPAVEDLIRHEKMAEIGGQRFRRQKDRVSTLQAASKPASKPGSSRAKKKAS